MKKVLASALTGALVMGAASTTFAAANPFSDVPAGHWAYDAVTQLAADGIIEGYGDGTYRGDRQMTRYEMAQFIARLMAKNPQGVDKAMLDKLAAEFSEELNNLGVRVANLEKHADKVQWTGKIEYTYTSERLKGKRSNRGTEKINNDGYLFRLEPKAEVKDHWTVNARLDANGNMKKDSSGSVEAKRIWAQGDYDNFQIKLGKMEFYTNERGLIWDDEYSGAQVTFGNRLKATIMAGRVGLDDTDSYRSQGRVYGPMSYDSAFNSYLQNTFGAPDMTDSAANMQGINLQYDVAGDRGFYGGLGFYRVTQENFRWLSKNFDSNKAQIWSVNAGYKFGRKADLWAAYARNSKADIQNNAWQVEFDYGTYKDRPEKGDWKVYLAYRRMGFGASLQGTYDGVMQGTRGIEIGAAYAPFKNVGLLVKYFNGKSIAHDYFSNTNDDAEKLFGRVEFFF